MDHHDSRSAPHDTTLYSAQPGARARDDSQSRPTWLGLWLAEVPFAQLLRKLRVSPLSLCFTSIYLPHRIMARSSLYLMRPVLQYSSATLSQKEKEPPTENNKKSCSVVA